MTDSQSTSQTKPAPRRVREESGIYRTRTGKLEICHRDASGRLRWQVVGGGIQEARAIRDKLKTKAHDGEEIVKAPRLTFGDAAERWMAERVVNKAASTQAGYRNSLDRHLLPRFGKRRLSQITAAQIAALVTDLRAEGKAEAQSSRS